MEEAKFNAAAKSVAALVTALLAVASHVLGLSPEFASQHFLDLITSAICSLASLYYAVQHRKEA